MKLTALLFSVLFVGTFSSLAQEAFIPSEIVENNQYEFILYHFGDRFELHSCLADELYQDHLIRPAIDGGRAVHRGTPDKPPMVVTGGEWENGCLIINYTDSELPDSDWVDLLVTITKLNPQQIKLIHQ